MRLLFSLLTILLYMRVHAQDITLEQAKAFADLLVKKDILNPKGRDLLLKEINSKNIEVEHPSTVKQVYYTSDELSQETILQFCATAFRSTQMTRMMNNSRVEERIPREDPMRRTTWVLPFGFGGGKKGYENTISAKRSTLGFTRTRTLKDFHEMGLIDDRVFEDCKRANAEESIIDEGDLLELMVQRSMYYKYYTFNKKEQEEFIAHLVSMGLLTPEAQQELLHSYRDYELKTIPEMLAYSKRYIQVDLSAYQPNPLVTYPVVFQHLKKLLPTFDYKDLKVQVIEEKESDLIREDVKLSFEVNGSTYTQTFFHDYRKPKPLKSDPKFTPSRIDQDFHKGVNRWLTDEQSPYKLYTVNLPEVGEGAYGKSRVGLLLLKEGEAEQISEDAYFLSRESFDSRLRKRNIDKLIGEFTDQGFFSHLTQGEMERAKQKVATTDIGSIEEVLLQFPKTIVLFDWETGNLNNPYEELTNAFAAASRGGFTLTHVVDDYKKGSPKVSKVKYGFTLNGHRYDVTLKYESDWLDPQFLELLKKALKEQKVEGDIYYCVDNGQEAGYIFLTAAQHAFITKAYPDLLK